MHLKNLVGIAWIVSAAFVCDGIQGALEAQLFSEVGAGAGVADPGNNGSMAWADYNDDGYEDFYVSTWAGPDRLYRNDGSGGFTDELVNANMGDGNSNTLDTAWADYDNDGDADLFVNIWRSHPRLYRNEGNETFTQVAASAGIVDLGDGPAVAWGDYDNDGHVDLLIGNPNNSPDPNWHPSRLYRNQGNGTFSDVTASAQFTLGLISAVGWGDYDNDGDLDIYMVHGNQPNRLYRNDGLPFAEVGVSAGVNDSGNGVSFEWGDYDNDGDLDLYLANNGPTNRLYRNDGGTFADETAASGTANPSISVDAAWGDYDNDGDLDLYSPNGFGGANKLYDNNGSGVFTDVASTHLMNDTGDARGASWMDYDNDGDLDMYVVNGLAGGGGINRLYRNNGNGNNWLVVKTEGTVSNRSAIGARVRAVAGGQSQLRDVSGSSGHYSQSSFPAEFGFGGVSTVDSLVVDWPSGITDILTNVSTNQLLTLVEGASAGQPLTVTIPDTTATYGEDLLVPVRVTDTSFHGIVAAELFVTYSSAPSGLVSVFASGASAGSLTSTWSIESNVASGPAGIDTLKIAMATDTDALSGEGTLAVLHFTVADQRAPAFTDLDITHLLFNDGSPTATEDPGSVTLVGNDGVLACAVFSTGSTTQAIPGDQIDLTYTDADENRNVGVAETYSVAVTNGAQTETVTVTETGVNTGVFTGSINTAFSLGLTSGDGVIQAQAGDLIQFCVDDSLDSAGATVVRCVDKDVVGGADGLIVTTIVTQPGDTLRVKVTDADLNTSISTAETATVTATNPTTGESETIVLTEIAVDDSVFFGIVKTASGAAAGPLGDATLNTQKGDVLDIDYVDQLTAIGGTVTLDDDNEVVDPFGDADGNGNVQAFDAAKVLLHVLVPFLTGTDSLAANLDLLAYDPAQGKITPFDAAQILKKRVGLIGRFPVQEDEADNHPQPETDNSTPKLVPDERRLALLQGDGYISVWMDDRSHIVSGDLSIGSAGGQVEIGPDLGNFLLEARPTPGGLRVVFAGAEAAAGAGEVLRLYGAEGRSVQIVQAAFNDGRIIGQGLASHSSAVPRTFALHPNAPNPFNPETAIDFALPRAVNVKLDVYDLLGQRVRTLVSSPLLAGEHRVLWDGLDEQGRSVASGVYLYRLEAGPFSQTRRMTLLK